jgi:putative Mg2+ transporter-C (MgtC) family protein
MDALLTWLTAALERDPTAVVLPIAFLCGLAIGTEREVRGHQGQLRVCILVAVAAAGFADLVVTRSDSSNWGAGFGAIAQGVGFLGAGLILKEGLNLRGMSTAATLWCVAAAGASAGAREILSALVITALALVTNVVLRPISVWAHNRRTRSGPDPE